MFVEENNSFQDYKFIKGNLKFAVIGHIEWINFIEVDQLPKPGLISHARKSLEYPAGGGSVIAKRLRELTNRILSLRRPPMCSPLSKAFLDLQ